MKIKTDNDRLILLGAFRYALGRKTYMVSVLVEELERNWDSLEDYDKTLICKEIKEAIKEKRAGDSCDIESWNRILFFEGI